MPVFRLKVHEIQAVQWKGNNKSKTEVIDFCHPSDIRPHLDTLDITIDNKRVVRVFKTDWLVRREGTIAVYNDRVFREHYEEVE